MMVGSVVLVLVSPDSMAIALTVVMTVILGFATWFGIRPLLRYTTAFDRGLYNIHTAVERKPESPWVAVMEMSDFFGKTDLDELFNDYKQKAQQQRKSGIVVTSINDTINEELVAVKTWQSVMHQVPGTLTGLGILGTFIGLIFGIHGIQFESMETAITSIQKLLSGIEVAFYTSIAGVILSILFNMLYKVIWNMTIRELDLFSAEFQRCVIPAEDEQARFRQKKELQEILDRLDRLPKANELALSTNGGNKSASESILLPQIVSGLKNNEFTFYLQPRYDLNSHKIIGAEALVRWNHPKLGLVLPSVFMQTIENNGYITKLDYFIWEQVASTIRRWIDSGSTIVPITVNISKTDILALDVSAFFRDIVDKYRIPPRYLEMDISQNAYVETQSAAIETETVLRQTGFRVNLDGFTGDFVALNSIDNLKADTVKLNLRGMKDSRPEALPGLLNQAANMKMSVIAEGIENMEQMAALRKGGCTEGQGYFLSKPMPIDAFEEELNKR